MRSLGWEQCSVHEFEGSDEEATALAITLNRSAQFGKWDIEVLDDQLKGLEGEFDLDELGWSEDEMAGIFPPDEGEASEPEDITPQIGRMDELAEQWVGEGRLQWQHLTWEQNPTQFHIVNALADLPVLEWLPATVSRGSTNLVVPERLSRVIR